MKEPEQPVLFSKFNNSLVGPDALVDISGLQQVNYEVELAVVIGQRGKNIPESEAVSYVRRLGPLISIVRSRQPNELNHARTLSTATTHPSAPHSVQSMPKS